MAWLRTDDQAPDHPKVLRAQSSPRPADLVLGPEGFAGAVFGLVSLAAAWSAGKLQDGWIPETLWRRVTGRDADLVARSAVRANLLSKRQRGPLGEWGWYVIQDDELLHMRSREEVHADREKSRVTRQTGATREVRLRDGDQCRYCGKSVNWADRVSARGGSYDHPDPANRDVFVVACLGCNRTKAARTPTEAAMPLLPVPDEPLIGPQTAQQFHVPQSAPARASNDVQTPPARAPKVQTPPTAARGPQAFAAATAGPESSDTAPHRDLDLPTDLPSEVVQTYPRRDGSGSGQVGSVSRSVSQPVRAGPRGTPRGKRGRGRGRRNQPPTKPEPKD